MIKNRLCFTLASQLACEVHFLPEGVAEKLDTNDTSKQPVRSSEDK